MRHTVFAVALFMTFLMLRGIGFAGLTFDMYPQNISKKENPIKVSFNGKIYENSSWFDEVEKMKFNENLDEKFIIKSLETNRKGSRQEIVALWAPDEQAETNAVFGDPVFLSGSKGYLSRIKYAAFLAKVEYGPYVIFYVQYSSPDFGDEIAEYVIKSDNYKYYMTNKLKEDPVFVYLGEAMKKQISLKSRK